MPKVPHPVAVSPSTVEVIQNDAQYWQEELSSDDIREMIAKSHADDIYSQQLQIWSLGPEEPPM